MAVIFGVGGKEIISKINTSMKTLFVVYILINSFWIPGDMLDGWGIINYATEKACQERVIYAEKMLIDMRNWDRRIYNKRFECISNKITNNTE